MMAASPTIRRLTAAAYYLSYLAPTWIQTTVNSGGVVSVIGLGKVDFTTINDGGQVIVGAGKVDHTTINNGGELVVI